MVSGERVEWPIEYRNLIEHVFERFTDIRIAGNMFTCWADWSRVSEHDADGKLLMFSHLNREYMIKHVRDE